MRTSDLPVIDCPAEPRERGRVHGETLRAVIGEKIGRWHEAIDVAYGASSEIFLPRFLAGTDFRSAIARHAPDLLEEVAGIAEGADIDAETVYAMQLMDEEWWFGKSRGDGHCSSLAMAPTGDGPTMVGQTMDLPRWHEGAQALLRITEMDGSETMVFTSAGMVGLNGVSGRGLGICVNTLAQLGVSPKGLPVAFVMRRALARGSVAGAAGFLRSVGHASGQNYQLGDRYGIATLECSAGGAAVLEIEGGRSLHTNHPLVSRDALSPDIPLHGSDNSRARLESLRADLAPSEKAVVDVEAVKTALSACRAGGEVSIEPSPSSPVTEATTFGAMVCEIGDAVELSISAGPPSTESWRSFTLRSA
ncbi:C45 family peptidase [Aquamicrobium sp. LC103]|uniref:C45 family autoproteolytic acyltransferase/hydolase n=1 Tax=Aquamicrobium sp. LC103 TaxID=1120658 RepID=UPI00063E7CFA|nr:C45 family peptidase [Aquamicrobium sp. LC103]TKT77420.1 peptidase C45 [Aquamicrobium sp. LC103]